MRGSRSGFTLIEVTLFLAITGLLFIGIAAGVQNSIFQQRYNDSVQNFAEFLRSVYSQVMNVESDKTTGGGRSDQAIYGKLVTFGDNAGSNKIVSYTVVGDIDDKIGSSKEGVLVDLQNLNINIRIKTSGGSSEFAGIVEDYVPRWGAKIETTGGGTFQGAILIVRHPSSGTVYTFVNKNDFSLDKIVGSEGLIYNKDGDGLVDKFGMEQVDFCVDPNGGGGDVRRDVRIANNARNASGIEIMPADSSDNLCNRR